MDAETLVVVNKADLGLALPPVAGVAPLAVSALTGEGFDPLIATLSARLTALAAERAGEDAPLTRERHREIAAAALSALDRALTNPEADLRAEDVRLAVRELGRITGRVDRNNFV